MLINAQPIKFWLNLVGGIIALYFLWKHELTYAIIFGGIIIFSGTFLAAKYSTSSLEQIAETLIGKAFLRYSSAFGLACYLGSHILIPLAFWLHRGILLGMGVVLLAIGLIQVRHSH